MSNNDKILRRKIISLALAPAVIISCVVIASFALLQGQQIQNLEQEKLSLAEHIAEAQASELQSSADFDRLARSLLAIQPLRRVSLLTSDGELLATDGLPNPHADPLSALPTDLQAGQWKDSHVRYALLPLDADTTGGDAATAPFIADGGKLWLLLELDRHRYALLQQQAFTALLLLILAALAASAFCSYRLRAQIVTPLQILKKGLNDCMRGRADGPILVGDKSGFQDIADAIGELNKKQRLEQDDMQSYVEEYTQELRESLESMEIQNIELDMARKNALESSRAKSEFLANASHELRTPLNGILGFASLLSKTDLTDQQTDYVTTIEHSAQGLLTIINDILDISRLETGDLILEYKPVPIYSTIEEVLRMHAPSAHEKKLRLVTMIDGHVPENLLGDPQRLKQVIANLISNAIKYSDKGTIVIRINFMGETDNQVHLKFSVADSGSGLTREQQDGLFESFGQMDTADNRLHGGTGLGLAIAKGLVQRMHGEIGVDSEVGRGSTFWFTARLGINNRHPAGNRYNHSLIGQHALVYDHNATSRAEVTHLLTTWGATFTETGDLQQVAELAAQTVQRFSSSIAIIDAQIQDNVFDKEQLLTCIEHINSQFRLPVIVVALPNLCRILEPALDKLQAVALSRPVSHHQLHRVICTQLGVSSGATDSLASPVLAARPDASPRILAVDDNAANLRLVSELLKGHGAVVETASSGPEAIALCADRTYDLILMDIQMPGMDGLETTRRLRAQETGRRTPIVALTAHAVNEQKTRLLMAGMDDYLSKPVSDLELRHIVDRWVNQTETAVAAPLEKRLSPIAAPELPVFDLSESVELANHKPDLARDMMQMLLATLKETRTGIDEAVAQEDIPALQERVHKFYGGCCYCGVPALRSAAAELDQHLQRGQYNGIAVLAQRLCLRIDELHEWAEQQDLEVLFGEE